MTMPQTRDEWVDSIIGLLPIVAYHDWYISTEGYVRCRPYGDQTCPICAIVNEIFGVDDHALCAWSAIQRDEPQYQTLLDVLHEREAAVDVIVVAADKGVGNDFYDPDVRARLLFALNLTE